MSGLGGGRRDSSARLRRKTFFDGDFVRSRKEAREIKTSEEAIERGNLNRPLLIF